jgi:DNA modification methylase
MNKIEFGDCRETMRKWASQGVKAQTCITSPPYFGLRDYGHEGQIGHEETPEEFIKQLVEVFRCVWDVLEDDGTLWLNIGDSYCNSNGFARASPEYQREGRNNMPANDRKLDKLHATGLKTKDLIGIPWMLAFALRADGWYLRQDIIWHKPNPMPESVNDRCTKSHEYIFLLSKSHKYHFDHEAIKEEGVIPAGTLAAKGSAERQNQKGVNARPPEYKEYDGQRNKRSVWTVNTKPYSGAHFAVFPEELIEPCILAGAPLGGIVLDPFMGSGTTAQVAQNLGRQYIGCELNPKYEKLQKKRTAQTSLDFA